MLARALRHATFANVCSFLALTVALGTGTAYAANTIRSGDIVNGQVKTRDLAAGAVTTEKLRDAGVLAVDLGEDAVTSDAIADGTVNDGDLGANSVGSSELANDSVDGGEVNDDSLTAHDLAANAVGTSEVGSNALTTDDVKGADVSGNISLSAGAAPVGRCTGFDVAVGGASTGEGVVLSVQEALPAGILLYAQRVAATNTVQAYVCNFSGAAQPALTDIAVRVITFG